MSYKYYSTQRPIAPGTFPKPDNNKVVGLENFDDRIYCEDIQLYAWGYIEYEKPLTQYDCNSYELIPVKTKVLHLEQALAAHMRENYQNIQRRMEAVIKDQDRRIEIK